MEAKKKLKQTNIGILQNHSNIFFSTIVSYLPIDSTAMNSLLKCSNTHAVELVVH